MRRIATGTVALIVVVCAFAQQQDSSNGQGRAGSMWPARSVVPIRSIDPYDDDFSDLRPLKKFIGSARVVQLGEPSHGDGATFYAKQRLIRFLHSEMGFNVLAWESGFFDCEEMDKALHTQMPIPQARAVGLFSIWSNGPFVTPVFEYARSTYKTSRPLRMTGFDIQYSSSQNRSLVGERAFTFLAGFRPDLATAENRKAIQDLIAGSYAPREAERQNRLAILDRILASFAYSQTVQSRDFKFYRKVFQNIAAFDQQRWMSPSQPPPVEADNFRNQKMGENLTWLAKEWYPNEKIIVWAANSHILRNAAKIDTMTKQFRYEERITMGDITHQSLGKAVYTIGFTAYSGEVGNPFMQKPRTLPMPPVDSLETQLHVLGHQHLFVDLDRLSSNRPLRKPMLAWPLGYHTMSSAWADNFDAIIFSDVMFPNTKDAKLPDGVRTRRTEQTR
jgi:erythromycin esterase